MRTTQEINVPITETIYAKIAKHQSVKIISRDPAGPVFVSAQCQIHHHLGQDPGEMLVLVDENQLEEEPRRPQNAD